MNIKEILKDKYKDGMTSEEILKALETVELEDSTKELDKVKKALDNATSEAANYKKQLRDKLTDEERAKAEQDQQLQELKNQLDVLQREKALAEHKAQYVGLGYDEQLAESSAKALIENDFTTLFSNQKSFLEAYNKKVEADLLKGTPRPSSNGNPQTVTQEQFDNFTYKQRIDLMNSNPQLFKELNTIK